MKMAKASEADLSMAMDFTNALESLMRYGHMPCDGEHDEPADFDIDDPSACQRALQTLFDIAERGSLMRVVWGMAVLLDPANEIVDPDCDVLERHPKFDAAPDLLAVLKAFSDYVHAEQSSTDGAVTYSTTTINHWAFLARAAIAKATEEAA